MDPLFHPSFHAQTTLTLKITIGPDIHFLNISVFVPFCVHLASSVHDFVVTRKRHSPAVTFKRRVSSQNGMIVRNALFVKKMSGTWICPQDYLAAHLLTTSFDVDETSQIGFSLAHFLVRIIGAAGEKSNT